MSLTRLGKMKSSSAPRKPIMERVARLSHNLELDGSTGLLLDHCRARSQRSRRDDVSNLHLNNLTAAQLAVDCKVEQRSVAQSPVLVEKKADRPDVARFERALRADHVT